MVKYYYNEKSLANNFLPVTQRSVCDYNRNYINFSDETWEIQSINNLSKKEIYIEKWYIENKCLILPNETEVEVVTINLLDWAIKDFILENDVTSVEISLEQIEANILSSWSYFVWWLDRIKWIIRNKELSEDEKTKSIKNEYWDGWSSVCLWNNIKWWNDYKPWLGILYKMNNWQVFPFSWKKVYKIYQAEYEEKIDEKNNLSVPEIKKTNDEGSKWAINYKIGETASEKKNTNLELLSKDYKQLWIFENNEFIATVENKEIDINEISEKIKDTIRIELKKKALFWLIENNKMWKKVLEKQPVHKKIDKFNLNQLNKVRELINNNEFHKIKMPQILSLYECYNLEDLDEKDGYKWEFANILKSFSREYTKAAFNFRLDKIIKRINEYDNPVQTIEEYFSSIKTKNYDFTKMDLVKFKKVVSWISILYNHDLISLPRDEIKDVILNINKFMRWVKKHISENKIECREIDQVLAKWFLKNYLVANSQ
jgi:hypothetical protein